MTEPGQLTRSQMNRMIYPDGFAEIALGMGLYAKQKKVLQLMGPAGAMVSFVSCNEGGKTSRVVTALILWHLWMFPKGHILSTSGSFMQIKSQLVPALHRFRERFPAWTFFKTPKIETEDIQCFWEGFSTNEAGKFEGHHEDGPESPLLLIVDEAKTVKDPIYEAAERCKPTRMLITSSPGYAEGEFYRSHTSRREFYQRVKQTASECPHIDAAWVEKMEKKWGKGHPLVRSMIYAEFMQMVEDAIISLKDIEDLYADPPDFNPAGGRKAFCDFAAGGDENVLALRTGNRVTIEKAWRDEDTMNAVGQFITEFNRLGLKPHEIEGDEGGLGKPMCDALMHAGWPIIRVNNGSAPRWDEHYVNIAAETWHEGGVKIRNKAIILPNDDELRGQLMSRKKKPGSKGRLAVESKEDMRGPGRNLPSPDRADAVLGAMSPLPKMESFNIDGPQNPWDQEEAEEMSGRLAGFDPGIY